jgi:hypothetical protein
MYTATAPHAERRRPNGVFLAIMLVVLGSITVAGVVAANARDEDEATSVANSGDARSELSEEEQRVEDAWDRTVERLKNGGWVRYDLHPAVPIESVPNEAWVRLDPLGTPPEDAETLRTPVYDAPDGELIGYHYPRVGFVPPEVANSGDFDPRAAEEERWGCASPDCPTPESD